MVQYYHFHQYIKTLLLIKIEYLYILPPTISRQPAHPAMPTTTHPAMPTTEPITTELKLCQILGTSVEPTQEQLGQIIPSLVALLEFGVNMASKIPNKWQYAPNGSVTNGSVMTVADLMSLFEGLKPSLTLVYYGDQVDDASASAIVGALCALACTIDTLIEQSPSSPYHPRQAVGVVCDALFCVQPKEEDNDGEDSDREDSDREDSDGEDSDREDSDGEDSEAGPLRRLPARPYNYLGDVRSALTTLQKQGQ